MCHFGKGRGGSHHLVCLLWKVLLIRRLRWWDENGGQRSCTLCKGEVPARVGGFPHASMTSDTGWNAPSPTEALKELAVLFSFAFGHPRKTQSGPERPKCKTLLSYEFSFPFWANQTLLAQVPSMWCGDMGDLIYRAAAGCMSLCCLRNKQLSWDRYSSHTCISTYMKCTDFIIDLSLLSSFTGLFYYLPKGHLQIIQCGLR